MEFKAQRAIYLQIADHICEKILKKTLQENDRIPSVRELAVNIEVNPNTVVRTYTYLEEQGIIYKQRGIGYFVAKNAFKKVLRLQKETFLKKEWPHIRKMMDLLEISFEDLKI
ncbi:MAG: GntR family transcriptional regulator [Gammaproteobacteria bacterium]|jgi:DNA-binding transcriptional regulator YhcF (GntR family)